MGRWIEDEDYVDEYGLVHPTRIDDDGEASCDNSYCITVHCERCYHFHTEQAEKVTSLINNTFEEAYEYGYFQGDTD